jgi:hypothetical protein
LGRRWFGGDGLLRPEKGRGGEGCQQRKMGRSQGLVRGEVVSRCKVKDKEKAHK